MSGLPVGLILELVVIGLLMTTVGYCYVLNGRLKRLRSAQDDMRLVINDLNKATQQAENAVIGLKATADEAERKLDDKLNKAKLLTHNLTLFVEQGAGRTSPGDGDISDRWRQTG